MGKIFGFIVVALGLVGAFMLVSEKLALRKVSKNSWADKLRPLIAAHAKPVINSDSDSPWYAMEGSYMGILALMHQAREHKYDIEVTLGSALSGMQSGQSRMIQEALQRNFETADRLGVFKDPANLIRMQRGDGPYAKSGGWEEEPLVVGHVLSPLLAPEAANSLVNLVIMPKAAQDLQTHDLRGFSTDTIKKWREEKIITPESAKDIYDMVLAMKAR
jgi:hypothetical protein